MKHKNLTIAFTMYLATIASSASALEPIANIPQFEKNMEACLKEDKAPIACLNTLLKKHHPQGETSATELEGLTNIVKQWLGGEGAVALHLVKSVDFGKVIFRRIYLIEDSAGKLMIANITYEKTKGILHLRDVQFTNQSASFDKLFENEI